VQRFNYKAFNAKGRLVHGNISALSIIDAKNQIAATGLTPVDINVGSQRLESAPTHAEPWWKREIGPSRSARGTTSQLAEFFSDLAVLTSARVPLEEALGMLAATAGRFTKRQASELRRQLVEGQSLSQAMASQPRVFAQEIIATIRAAEAAGQTADAVKRLAEMWVQRAKVESELRSALIYPIVLLLACVAIMVVVLSILLPAVKPLFDEARAPMPGILAAIDLLGIFLQTHWPGVATSLISIILTMRRLLSHDSVKPRLHRVAFDLPVLGQAICRAEASRFFRSLGAQTSGGVSLLPALVASKDVIRNYEVRRRLDLLIDQVREGASLSASLQNIHAFPAAAAAMVKVGETAGRVSEQFLYLAELFERQRQVAIRRTITFITPALTLGVGIFVGFLMLSVVGAIASLGDLALR
jgi:general secretion pathway protein F